MCKQEQRKRSEKQEQMKQIRELTQAPSFIGPLTRENRQRVDEIIATGERWAQSEEGRAILARARDPKTPALRAEGTKMTPEEVAEALGAKIVGKISRSHW